MTHREIAECRQRLIDIKGMSDSGERNKAYIELAAELGASGCGRDMPPGERDVEHIRGINRALQTASIIDMCRTATQGYEMATEASKSASKQFRMTAGVTIASAVAASLSAAAAWVAVMCSR